MYLQIVKQVTMEKKIYIGFFENAQGAGSIQIAADFYGLIELRKTFLRLSNGLDSFNFSDLQCLDKKIRINIVAYADTMNAGLRLSDNGKYEWKVTKEKWAEFSDNLLLMFEIFNYIPIHFESNSKDKKDLQVNFELVEYQPIQNLAFH